MIPSPNNEANLRTAGQAMYELLECVSCDATTAGKVIGAKVAWDVATATPPKRFGVCENPTCDRYAIAFLLSDGHTCAPHEMEPLGQPIDHTHPDWKDSSHLTDEQLRDPNKWPVDNLPFGPNG